jgi:hypothetical protein
MDVFLTNGFEIVQSHDEQNAQIKIMNNDQQVFLYKLRDRTRDGKSWKKTELCEWNYNHQNDVHKGIPVEQSRYWGHPEHPLTDIYDVEIAQFIKDPFDLIPYDNPSQTAMESWICKWKEVINNSPNIPYPGQQSLQNVAGLAQHIDKASTKVLKEKKYTHLTSVPSWVHIAQINRHYGFSFSFNQDRQHFDDFEKRLPEDKKLASWVGVLQFWNELADSNGIIPEDYVDKYAIIRDESRIVMTYPLSPERNLWQEKQL